MSKKQHTPAWWYGSGVEIPMWARVGEHLFAALSNTRAWLYSKRWRKAFHPGIPVVVVGNITVGGTGKTPLVMAIIRHLQARGFKPGLATRGYGRQDAGTPRWITDVTPANLSGDEALMIAKHTGIPVRADARRARAAKALREAGCDIVICDDGIQHLALARDIEIEVIDCARGYGNGRLLPAGPLRELPAGADRFAFRVVNMGAMPDTAAEAIGEDFVAMLVKPARVKAMNSARTATLEAFRDQRVHAVAGIGHPKRFFDMLKQHGIAVVPHAFPDHHDFKAEDFAFSSDLPVLMTSKDATKCGAFAQDHWYEVPVDAVLPETFWQAFDAKLPHTGVPND